MHCQIAFGSESIGTMRPPFSDASLFSRCPAITIDSLLASPTVLPASRAAAAAWMPTVPDMACKTKSTSSSRAISIASSRAAPPILVSATDKQSKYSGLNSRTCSASSSELRPAASATTSNSSRNSRTTSRVCAPIEPVEPSITMRLGMVDVAVRPRKCQRPLSSAGELDSEAVSRPCQVIRHGPGRGFPSL